LNADVRLPAPLRLLASGRLATPPTPNTEVELAAPHLPQGAVARPRERGAFQPRRARRQPMSHRPPGRPARRAARRRRLVRLAPPAARGPDSSGFFNSDQRASLNAFAALRSP